jgi:antitoxin (DNA-binding transcriptional repressor) of toxin-antitoxin stability system
VNIGDSLTVTRLGKPVAILKVSRVVQQNVVIAKLTPDLRDKVRKGDEVILQR